MLLELPTAVLKSPFPYAGGKSKVADLVWKRFGNVDNFVEPFAGTLAVLLRRPAEHFRDGYRVETCNDLNHYIVNFWRAVKNAPDEVAKWCDNPVLEADLHARHQWLVKSREAVEFRNKMKEDPEHYDAKIAGWWVWGQCCWIGGAWCAKGYVDRKSMPRISNEFDIGVGVCGSQLGDSRPQLTDAFDIGRGVNASHQMPSLRGDGGAAGSGVVAFGKTKPGTCEARQIWLQDWMGRLADRLRLTRTCYGHWSRICNSKSTMTRLGLTGAFLDPPYPEERSDTGEKSRDGTLYATDNGADLNALRDEVLSWCQEWGPNKQVRIAVCGYEGDGYEVLLQEGWTQTEWETSGGYGNQSGKKKSANAKRERIWWSPYCLSEVVQPSLFGPEEAT